MQEKKEKKGKGKLTPLDKVLELIDDIIFPEKLDIVIARAKATKQKRQDDEIEAGDIVMISPATAPTTSQISGGANHEVIEKTRDGMYVIELSGVIGKFTRDKLLLVKKTKE